MSWLTIFCLPWLGDSRAVIQRQGDAVALTSDHKPDREDEAVSEFLGIRTQTDTYFRMTEGPLSKGCNERQQDMFPEDR